MAKKTCAQQIKPSQLSRSNVAHTGLALTHINRCAEEFGVKGRECRCMHLPDGCHVCVMTIQMGEPVIVGGREAEKEEAEECSSGRGDLLLSRAAHLGEQSL